MALHRVVFASAFATLALLGCQGQKPAGQTNAQPVVEALPETKAIADVDRRATLVLKQELVTKFPQNSSSAIVEAGLVQDGYSCGPNPAAPDERACLKVKRETACEINTIVRTAPYSPDKAQVIRICETQQTDSK